MLKVEDQILVTVTSVHPFGVYAYDAENNTIFMHISDHLDILSRDKGFSDYAKVGQQIQVKVLRLALLGVNETPVWVAKFLV